MSRYSPEALDKKRKGNEARFLRDARAKYGDRFDYSQIQYVRQKIPVTIICPTHGPFNQTPDKHLQSALGCPMCGGELRAQKKRDGARDEFLVFFREKFGEQIELVSEYVRAQDSITCRCKIHGTFKSTPDRLRQWEYGCPICSQEAKSKAAEITQEEFVRRVHEKFGTKFDLTNATYSGMYNKVKIGCPFHGDFLIAPTSFLGKTSHGCPECGMLYAGTAENRIQSIKQGLTKPRPTTIAVLKVEVFGITSYKIGISTRTLLARYREALREILYEATLEELDALYLERAVHLKFFRFRDTRILSAGMKARKRWSGDTELYQEECVAEAIRFMDASISAIAKGVEDYWGRNDDLLPPLYEPRKVRMIQGVWNSPKPVIRLDTLETYPSATAAAKAIGSQQGTVSAVCRGTIGHSKGVKFAFLSDYEADRLPQQRPKQEGKHHHAARAVHCIDTGLVFDTITEAERQTGVNGGKISMVCKGTRKEAGGFRWEYVEQGSD